MFTFRYFVPKEVTPKFATHQMVVIDHTNLLYPYGSIRSQNSQLINDKIKSLNPAYTASETTLPPILKLL